MATRPIPAGTVNFPVNLPRELRLEAGRLAFLEDKPLGALIREMLAERVEAARRTGRLIRHHAGVALVVLGIGALAAASISPASQLPAIRRMRGVRSARVETISFAARVRCARASA